MFGREQRQLLHLYPGLLTFPQEKKSGKNREGDETGGQEALQVWRRPTGRGGENNNESVEAQG